jgi:hypothetical protein
MKTTTALFFVTYLLSIPVAFSQAPVVSWQYPFGGSSSDYGRDIQLTTDNGYVIAGHSYSNDGDFTANEGTHDFAIVKLHASRNIQWTNTFGGTLDDEAYSVCQASDAGYIVAGSTHSINGDVTLHYGSTLITDGWIIKVNSSGALVWQRTLGGTGYDAVNCVLATPDGGCIFAGATSSADGDITNPHGNYDFWVGKLDGKWKYIVAKKLWRQLIRFGNFYPAN